MNWTKNLAFGLTAVFAAALAFAPATASAQIDTRRGEYGYGRDRDRERDDRPFRWERAARDWEVRPSVDRAERQSNAFRAWYERIYSRQHFGRDQGAHDYKRDIQRLDRSMERLRHKADDHRPGIGRDELRDALKWGREINREIGIDSDSRFTYREWRDLRDTLNTLADMYQVRGI